MAVVSLSADRSSFDDLYRDEYVHMVRLAWMIVGGREIAEDLVQDAFTRMTSRYGSIEHPAAYLRVAVVNACRNELRRGRRVSRIAPTDAVVMQPEFVELFDGLKSLGDRHRAAIMLRYVDDRSDEEIARLLGVRRASVRSLVRRGLAQLREVIDDD